MKKIRIIALLAALVLGFCVYQYLNILNQPAEVPHTNVVVCAVDLPENTTITAEMVQVQSVISEAVAPNAVTDINSVVGMVMNATMYQGEQITANRLVRLGASDATSDSLAYVVQEGMRAITINVAINTGVANMLRPGNFVDVVANYAIPEETEPTDATEPQYDAYGNPVPTEAEEPEEIPVTRMLLQNVKVLAVDSTIQSGMADLDGYVTVTLEVQPEQALEVSFMEQNWALRLILRSSIDEEVVEMEEVILDSIIAAE